MWPIRWSGALTSPDLGGQKVQSSSPDFVWHNMQRCRPPPRVVGETPPPVASQARPCSLPRCQSLRRWVPSNTCAPDMGDLCDGVAVRHPPQDLRVSRLEDELVRTWGFHPVSMEYVPEGGGSHHWCALDDGGQRLFVTIDDLDDKDWLGTTRDQVFDGLSSALETAKALRESGLSFVVAPIAAQDGAVVNRLGGRYSASVFPYIDGRSYPFGPYPASLRDAAIEMIAELHRSTSTVRDCAPRHVLGYGDHRDLAALFAEPDRPWDAGPFSEPARLLLACHVSDIAELVGCFERLAQHTAAARERTVITHGEPHPANLIVVNGDPLLIDWDTAALAAPERDLALIVAGSGPGTDRYQAATSHQVDFDVITLYQLRWYLDDLAGATRLFRRPHYENPDTKLWWEGLGPQINQLPSWFARLS
jgi:spectinomycin phosphotransferase